MASPSRDDSPAISSGSVLSKLLLSVIDVAGDEKDQLVLPGQSRMEMHEHTILKNDL